MTKQMTTDRAGGTEAVPALARVSLREIREASFRALSAAGASHGEAWTARMVLDAELQGEGGVDVLLDDLDRGRWPREGVDLAETGSSQRPVTRLGDAQSNRLLRHGPLAVNLAVAEPGRGGVFVPGEVSGLSCLDAVLVEAALEQQRAVAVVSLGPGGAGTCRVSLSDGALGSGRLDDRGQEGTQHEDILLVTEAVHGEKGVWVVAPPPEAVLDLPALTWVSAAQRADRRAAAARDGCLVDAAAWDRLYAASRRYLVP